MLVYDGDCGFCTQSAKWIRRRLRSDVAVVPWQQLDLDAVGLTREQVETAAWWVDDRGHRYGGHLAIAHALLATESLAWRALGAVTLVPPIRWMALVGYRWVAANRGRLPGATEACATNANVSGSDRQADAS